MKIPQKTFDELESALLALEADYAAASTPGREAIRRDVILARRKAVWASKRAKDESSRTRKHEMAEWMLVWLESPGVFPAWVALRRKAATFPDTAILKKCV